MSRNPSSTSYKIIEAGQSEFFFAGRSILMTTDGQGRLGRGRSPSRIG
jgi:hypothetical protein